MIGPEFFAKIHSENVLGCAYSSGEYQPRKTDRSIPLCIQGTSRPVFRYNLKKRLFRFGANSQEHSHALAIR